ncbi:signal peptidase II [bacterium]|nr:signal peptidase II [bacterium]
MAGLRVLFVSVGVVLLDQVTKLLVRFNLEYAKSYEIVGNFVRFTYIENPGMAFGIQFGGQIFFTLFASLATIIIFIYIIKAREEKISLRLALAMILGGAIGNLIDRFMYGKVVDFVDVGVDTTRWPIFNVADSAVTVSMIMMITIVLLKKKKKAENENEPTSEQEAYS